MPFWACVLVNQEEPLIAHDFAHFLHHVQFCRAHEVMEPEADPGDIYGLGSIVQRLNEIASVQGDWTGERLESLTRKLQRRLAKVDPVVRGDLRPLERFDRSARIAARPKC
jgi:hypothetical protein